MVKYDASIIQQFADRLYKRASSIVASLTVIGILFGFGIGYALDYAYDLGTIGLIVGAALGAIIGFAIGQERAFVLKLQAQVALCQVQIEQNTRSDKN
jgi:F0F1-type ATP synthase assembly protein I